MSQSILTATAPQQQDQTPFQAGSADGMTPDETGLEYWPGIPQQTIRVKARVRSITAGKPLRYDLPNTE